MGTTPSILVVEDESSIASFVSLYLKNAGYGVRAVGTGSGAIAIRRLAGSSMRRPAFISTERATTIRKRGDSCSAIRRNTWMACGG